MKVLALLFVLAAAPAWAQSTRYPPEPVDKDREADAHSKLWEGTLDPGREPYQALVRDAQHLLDQRSPDATKAAIEKLDRAVELLPMRPDAYVMRGEAHLGLKQWGFCADDLGVAEDLTKPPETPDHARHRVELGICLARAGRFADAERTLAVAATTAPRGEVWLRLGEVRIALGKLDEAIDALTAATDAGAEPQSLAHWLLAVAYDRARRPGDAEEHAKKAAELDRSFTAILSPQYPLLGAGEPEYLLGLAYRVNPARPEYSMLYFRSFLAHAPDSPWRRRAEEHLREASAMDPTFSRPGGNAALELDTGRAIVKKVLPAMRACLAKLPHTVFEVTVTKVGPRTPESARDRPRYVMPPPGVTTVPVLNFDGPRADIDGAARCLEPLAEKLALPAPKDRDTFYKAAFLVVSP